jgi:hypothetical protein
MWRTCRGELTFMRASSPARPFCLVANSTLCQAEKLSSWVQPCQAVVNGHLWPLAFSYAAAATTTGQVLGAFSGSRPAALNASLL